VMAEKYKEFFKLSDFTGQEFTALQKANLSKATKDVTQFTVKAGEGLNYYHQRLKNVRSGAEDAMVGIKTSIFSALGPSLVEIFEVVDMKMIAATHHMAALAKTAIVDVVPGIRRFTGWIWNASKGLARMAGLMSKAGAVTKATGAAAGAAGGAGGGFGRLGKTVGGVGKGIGQFIGGIGKGIGSAISGVFQGLSTGLTTLAPALVVFGTAMIGPGGLGLLALVGFMFSFAAAARIMNPVLQTFVELFKVGMDGVVSIFHEFGQMKWTQMLAMIPVMLALGPALAMLGVGMLAMATSFALSLPGIAIFMGGMKLLGVKSLTEGGGIVSGVIGALAKSFELDNSMVSRAIESLALSAKFLVGFAAVGVIITTLAAAAVFAGMAGRIISFFGADSPMKSLANQGESIANTITSLVASMANLPAEGLVGVMSTMQQSVGFLTEFGKLQEVIDDMSPGAIARIGESIMNLFGVDSPMEKLRRHAKEIAKTIGTIQNEMSAQLMTPKQIETMQSIIIEGHVVADDKTTHQLLGQIVGLLAGGRGAPGAPSGQARRPGADVNALARGEI